jgi:hypothetical protein
VNDPGKPVVRSDWPIIILLAVSLALWALGDYQQAGGSTARLFPFGASGLAWYVLGLMLVAWVGSRVSLPRVPFRQSLFLLALTAPVMVVLLWAIALVESENLANGLLLAGLLLAGGVLARGLQRVSGRRQLLAVWLSLMTAIGFGWLSDVLYVRPGIWFAAETESPAESATTGINGERLLFEQSARIDRAVSGLAPRQPGVPNAFFVGFAGYGAQKVFAEEVQLAAQVIGARYGSLGRSLSLVNDQRDLDALPLATAAGLRHALREVGKRMDLATDVLFLVLSSHGAEGAELAVSNGALPLRPLGAAELADALRDAGIRWKVVVISACYSGSFIDALRDDQSIILTAAAPDRASFGCADDRDLTYFGEAFFRDALPAAPSLRWAFEQASAELDAREREEGVDPSRPEAFFGVDGERHVGGLVAGDPKNGLAE